jgi:WD40 repeat protein
VFRCLFPILNSYAVTGAEDHKLRLWPLDFTDFLLEAQHEGVVTNIRISLDGRKLAIGTNAGTLGVLNVSEHSYNTVLRCVYTVLLFI